jgi:hypothetical protein
VAEKSVGRVYMDRLEITFSKNISVHSDVPVEFFRKIKLVGQLRRQKENTKSLQRVTCFGLERRNDKYLFVLPVGQA